MDAFLKVNNQVVGPFGEPQIRQKLAAGEIGEETPAWRLGMPEWSTVGELFPAAAPAAPAPRAGPLPLLPPPLPAAAPAPPPAPLSLPVSPPPSSGSPVSSEGFRETPASLSCKLDGRSRPYQPDAAEQLAALAGTFLGQLENRLGVTARPNLTFFSHRLATAAIQRLRLDVLTGAALSPKGEEFIAGIAAYLAMITLRNWKRRGFRVQGRVHFTPGAADNELCFEAARQRDGATEVYAHDFLRDTHQLLLRPPGSFPYVNDVVYRMESLTLPSPEQLYLYGVCLMQSPHASFYTNWPKGGTPGGRPEDLEQSKELLIDDLHEDCGLPKDNPALRKLTGWVVFPPYGWARNDANDYNMMTVFSQLSEGQIVSWEDGVEYLRALLRCQAPDIRNLAARCLMVYRVPPQDSMEAAHYDQALQASDHAMAEHSMAKYQHQVEGVEATPEWRQEIERQRREWLQRVPPTLSLRTAAENDPEYLELSRLPEDNVEDAIRSLESLLRRYPDDWLLKVIHASLLMRAPDPSMGEAMLRELIQDPPDCSEAHARLGTLLKDQQRFDDSMIVYEDELRHWPWDQRAVDSCLGLVTEQMTSF